MEAEFILVFIDSFYMKMIWKEFAACFWREPYLIKRAVWGLVSVVPHIFGSLSVHFIFPAEVVRARDI